jgi:hypothetical protein
VSTTLSNTPDDLSLSPSVQRRRHIVQGEESARRNIITDGINAAKKKAEELARKVKEEAEKAAEKVKEAAEKAKEEADKLNHVDGSKSVSIPLNVDKTVNIATANLTCKSPLPPVSISAGVTIGAHGSMDLAVVIAGTLVPPDVTTFSLSAGLNAELTGRLTLKATSSGSLFDSGEVELFNDGLPALSIPECVHRFCSDSSRQADGHPSIFSIGPSISILGRTQVNMNAEVDLDVGINYQARNVSFSIPSQQSSSQSGDAAPLDSREWSHPCFPKYLDQPHIDSFDAFGVSRLRHRWVSDCAPHSSAHFRR